MVSTTEVHLGMIGSNFSLSLIIVLCEKPFTMTSKQANELVELAARLKLLLTVFHSQYP